MELAARIGTMAANGGDEAMYKELLLKLLNKQLTEIEIADEIDARGGHGYGVRPFYGQSNLTTIKMPNLITDNFSSFYFDGVTNLQYLYIDSATWIPGSFVNFSRIKYVYAPSLGSDGGKIGNSITTAPAGAVLDFGQSRTCQQLLDSWSTLFTSAPNTNWTFRCSDGDVAWNGSEWAKVTSSTEGGGY